jgi:hypothetical protein
MTTVEHRAPEKINDYWTAALKFYATGRTAEGLRAMAADEEMTRGLALLSGITPEEEREQVLGIASAIDALAAEGLTPEKCYFLAGLDRLLGPYPGAAALSAA